MSRSGYCEELEPWDLIRYRGRVASSIRGRRGQAMLRDLAAALDAMPEKRLIADDLVNDDGEVCALGALGRSRNLPINSLDYDASGLAEEFGVADPLVREIMFENDECGTRDTPEQRWQRMRSWVQNNLTKEQARG